MLKRMAATMMTIRHAQIPARHKSVRLRLRYGLDFEYSSSNFRTRKPPMLSCVISWKRAARMTHLASCLRLSIYESSLNSVWSSTEDRPTAMGNLEDLESIVETQNIVIIVLIALLLTLMCANIAFLVFQLCVPPGYVPVATTRGRHRYRHRMSVLPEHYDESTSM